MKVIKLLPRLAIALVACFVVSGCVVVDYETTLVGEFNLTEKAHKQYQIASAEFINIESPAEGKNELELLSTALNNKPGDDFGPKWQKVVTKMKNEPGNYDINSTNLSTWKLSTRSIAPTLFELHKGESVNVRAVMFIRPEKINPWWTMGYLLTGTILAPIQSRSYGAACVAILDNKGKTIDSRTIILFRSSWFSTLFPLALFGSGEYSIKSAGTTPKIDEKNLQIRVMSHMVVEALSAPPADVSKNWRNIRAATIESIANDNNDAAIKLLKSATIQKLGGEQCKNFLELLD